jgi:hypothetical protein
MKRTPRHAWFMAASLMLVSAAFADLTVELEGGPVAGSDPDVFEAAAPIYTLNGSAHADLDIFTSDVTVTQDLTFTMDNVNGGRVHTIGNVHITKSGEWDATFLADSVYTISSFGRLIRVAFNHTLNKDPNEAMLVDGEICDSGFITSRGTMELLANYSFTGRMSGNVIARKNGRIIKNYRYKDDFDQDFTNLVLDDQGVWSARYDIVELARNRLGGEGTIKVGPADDPVDTVEQKVSGTKNPRTGVYSWNTTSKSRADAKVKVTIRNTSSDLVPRNNSVSAAAQTRKF